MRSIDDGWESGDVFYLDDIEKCTESHLVEVNGVKNTVYYAPHMIRNGRYSLPTILRREKISLQQRVINLFLDGKITIHYEQSKTSFTIKKGKYVDGGAMIVDSFDSTTMHWVDEEGCIKIYDGIYNLKLSKTNESIEAMLGVKHRVSKVTAIISPNNEIWFNGRARWLKKFLFHEIENYDYYADLIHSTVPYKL